MTLLLDMSLKISQQPCMLAPTQEPRNEKPLKVGLKLTTQRKTRRRVKMIAQGYLVQIISIFAAVQEGKISPSRAVVLAMVAAGAITGAGATPEAEPLALLSAAIAAPAAFDNAFAFNFWTRLFVGTRPPELSSACRTTESIRAAR